nr:hypothetical protein [Tanacetum cinerariifolium]
MCLNKVPRNRMTKDKQRSEWTYDTINDIVNAIVKNDIFVFDEAVGVNTLKLKKLMNFFRSRKVSMIWSFGFLGVCKRTKIPFVCEYGLASEWNFENLTELLEKDSDEFILNHKGDKNDPGVISLKSELTIKVQNKPRDNWLINFVETIKMYVRKTMVDVIRCVVKLINNSTLMNTLIFDSTMMTCHLSIRPAATCTVPRTQLLAASRRYVAASYWTAASDVAPTSAPVSVGQRRRPPVNVVGQRRSTPSVNGGDRRSTMAVNDGRRWRTTVDCRWTTVDHHRTTGQRCTMMMCHLPIRPAATCTVPRTQLLAASRRHVAASYWTAASDVAPTSAPVNASTVAVNDGRRWRTTVDFRWTIVDHHRSTVVGRQSTPGPGQGLDRVWAGSGSGLGRPPAAATWQHPIGQPPVTWHPRQHQSAPSATGQCRRSTMVNAAGHRSTPSVNGGDRRSTVAVNDGRRWRTTVDCRWTTVDHHRTNGQRWLVGSQRLDLGRVWIGYGPGLDRVWAGSATWHATCQPRVHTCQPRVPTWHPRGC